MIEANVKNFAPDQDAVVVEVGKHSPFRGFHAEWSITVDRDEDGKVCIAIRDLQDHTETRLVLGQTGSTQLDV
jgi:hypothetical protein